MLFMTLGLAVVGFILLRVFGILAEISFTVGIFWLAALNAISSAIGLMIQIVHPRYGAIGIKGLIISIVISVMIMCISYLIKRGRKFKEQEGNSVRR